MLAFKLAQSHQDCAINVGMQNLPEQKKSNNHLVDNLANSAKKVSKSYAKKSRFYVEYYPRLITMEITSKIAKSPNQSSLFFSGLLFIEGWPTWPSDADWWLPLAISLCGFFTNFLFVKLSLSTSQFSIGHCSPSTLVLVKISLESLGLLLYQKTNESDLFRNLSVFLLLVSIIIALVQEKPKQENQTV